MKTCIFTKNGYTPADSVADGNRFLIANGYMGMRGTVIEADSNACPAVTLAGVYDRNGDRWREPVNAPRGLYAKLYLDEHPFALPGAVPLSHRLTMDYDRGVFIRETDFGPAVIQEERFAALSEPHLLAGRLTLTFRKGGVARLVTGISTDIWDINGPHLFRFSYTAKEPLLCEAVTGEKRIRVASAQSMRFDMPADTGYQSTEDGVFRTLTFPVRTGETVTADLFAAVYTSLDTVSPGSCAAGLAARAAQKGFDACLRSQTEAWSKVWTRSGIELEGNDEAALYLHASQYYLNSIAPRHADALSVPARGLSGQTYKGAIFWDSEIFLFPMFVYTQPEVARSLLRYRIETLPGAKKKAAEYGYRGAFYAWESQEGGTEGCTDFNVVDVFTHRNVRTYFRDKQIHISGDIVYALMQYYDITGDRQLLQEGGAGVILECARFYLSRAACHADADTVDYADVIGPDEYHERVTNNAFTNRMAMFAMESALALEDIFADSPGFFGSLIRELAYENDLKLIRAILPRIRRPRVRSGVLEQFDGYFALEDCSLETVRDRLADPREYWGGDHGVAGTTQIIKQADVIALMSLFPEEFTVQDVRCNRSYYTPRTEHGSSLSACMYALAACRTGDPDEAWDFFMKTASIDVLGGGKQWAGEIYIGGTHPASNGGAWMIAALGFAGMKMRKGVLTLTPHLPHRITCLRFPVEVAGKRLLVTVTHEGYTVEEQN